MKATLILCISRMEEISTGVFTPLTELIVMSEVDLWQLHDNLIEAF